MKVMEIVLDHGKVQTTTPSVAYRLTKRPRIQDILTNGLSPSAGTYYQYGDPKIFMITRLDPDTLERVGSAVITAGRTSEEMEDVNAVFPEIDVLEIDLRQYPHPVYADTSQGLTTAVYVTHPIEAARIRLVGTLDFATLKVKPV